MFNLESIEKSIESKMTKRTPDKDTTQVASSCLFENAQGLKNKLYFENLTDDCLFDNSGPKDEFIDFYKKIIKSGVGTIILGGVYLGINEKTNNNLSRISLEENIMSAYKELVKLAHASGCKIYLKIKSVYGRFNQLYNQNFKAKKATNFGIDPENKNKVLLRISDNKCTELINDLTRISMLSNIAGFDGIVIDASFNNIIGELSSKEYNKRIFGYYSNSDDFLSKALKQIDAKNNTIILKISIMSLFSHDSKNAFLCKNNRNFSLKHIVENIKKYISLGVDGFIFLFGTKENEFLSVFNDYQDELIYKEFYQFIRNFFNKYNIKNKFNEDINLFCYDNFLNLEKANELVENNIVNYIDITRNIYSDINYLKNYLTQKTTQKCIKCSYCNEKTQINNKIECLINPSLTNNENVTTDGSGKNIAIVGSGISALICAITLSRRGYIVHVFEQKNKLNPIGYLTTIFGTEKSLKEYYEYIESQIDFLVKNKKMHLYLNNKFTLEDVNKSYHAIVLATGFKTKLLTIVGAVQSHVHNIYDVLNNKNILTKKKNIVIYAKSILSLKLAKYLVEIGHENITIIIKDVSFIVNSKNANLVYLFYNLHQNHVKVLYFSKIIKINEDNIEVNFCPNINPYSVNSFLKIRSKDKLNFDRRQQIIDCDLLIYEPDIIPNNTLYFEIVSKHFPNEVYLIGNALENAELADHIKSGYFVGKNI